MILLSLILKLVEPFLATEWTTVMMLRRRAESEDLVGTVGCSREPSGGSKAWAMELPDVLEPFRARIEATRKPCLRISPGSEDPTVLQSRVGGVPVLPLGASWPRNAQGRPLHFLAQLNFSEMPALEGFPSQGLLLFFVCDDSLHGFDLQRPTSQDGFRALYFPEPPSPPYLDVRALGLAEPECFPFRGKARGLRFEVDTMPVSGLDYRASELGFETDEQSDEFADLFLAEGHRVGGYPGFSQTDPRQARPDLRDYELLFQLDSDEQMGLMWGDMGIGNFLIRPEALVKGDFSDILYNWDCG